MPKTDDYVNARDIVRTTLRIKKPEDVAAHAGGSLDLSAGDKNIVINLLNRQVGISWPEGVVRYRADAGEPSLQEQVSILHYLTQATQAAPVGPMITFREIPSGDFYYEPFRKRAQLPLVQTFGPAPERLLTVGAKLGGIRAELGDVAMEFRLFPKVPITLVLWRGDAEFAPEANILYDASVGEFFNAEEVAFLTGNIVYKLMALAK